MAHVKLSGENRTKNQLRLRENTEVGPRADRYLRNGYNGPLGNGPKYMRKLGLPGACTNATLELTGGCGVHLVVDGRDTREC